MLLVRRIMAGLVPGIGILAIILGLGVRLGSGTLRVAGVMLRLLGTFPLILRRGAVIVAVVLLGLVVEGRTPRPPDVARPIGKI